MDRQETFERIKAYFDAADRELARNGKLPLGSTEKGFWGTSHLDDVYAFCERTELEKKNALLDLGSGDGRVVFVTALFTPSTGIEYDEPLHQQALAAQQILNIPNVTLLCADYTQHDFSPYQVIFTYADHNFRWLDDKRTEIRDDATLYCYHDTFHPETLVKGKILWVGQIPIFSYTKHALSDDGDEKTP